MNEPVSSSRRLTFIALSILGLLAVGTVSAWYAFSPTPKQLLARGLTIGPRNPVEGERLLRLAISATGTHYPDAEIALCRLLARRGAWPDVLPILTNLDLSACRADLLLAFGRDVLADHRTEALLVLESLAQRSVSSESIPALELLMVDYQEWGNDDKVVTIANQLTRLEPDKSDRWIGLIKILVGMLRDAECIEAIMRSRQHNLPESFRVESLNILISCYIDRGNTPAARQALTELRQAEGESLRVRGREAFVSRLEGNLNKALEVVSGVIKETPQQPYPYFTRGVINLDLKRFEDAVQDLSRVISVQPNNVAAEFKLSEAYRGLGQNELASKHREHALRLSEKMKRIGALRKRRQDEPLNPQLYAELAQLSREIGEAESAHRWQQFYERVKHSD